MSSEQNSRYNNIKRSQENSGAPHGQRLQIERLMEVSVVLRESFLTMENIVNVQDKQGERISLDEVLRPRPLRQSAAACTMARGGS